MTARALNANLFVYGSLLTAERHPMGERLSREARLVGAATLQGRLYAISWYPGAVDSADPGDLVHGEIFALADPAASLAWLDQYEGVTHGPASVTKPAEYARLEREVRLVDGSRRTAWVYLYQRPVDGRTWIAGGRWSAR